MEGASNKIVHRDEITDEAFPDSADIDMEKLLDPESSALDTARLGSACRDWGFFQRTKESTVQFFDLPLDSKNAVAVRGDGFEGYGHHYSRLSKLDWAESVILITQPVQDRNMELWPTNPPMFRDALEEYSAAVTKLMAQLMGSMAADLGVAPAALQGAFAGKRQSATIHRYPPCRRPEAVIADRQHGGAHRRARLDGAAARRRHAGSSALVVNVGDILHVLTNGAYRSAEHRVVVNAERGRTTAVVFQGASVGGMVAPLPELLAGAGGGEAARYRAVPRSEYLNVRFSALAQRKGFLDTLKL
ncbi:unnamed protein product [Urochloa decumbens]|uniref:Fe2OG dioxygenase domain-containing protein n=1 Tax=Urochloa decumbens TaxID=240449 RepID=A0ABC9D6R8_9POAL